MSHRHSLHLSIHWKFRIFDLNKVHQEQLHEAFNHICRWTLVGHMDDGNNAGNGDVVITGSFPTPAQQSAAAVPAPPANLGFANASVTSRRASCANAALLRLGFGSDAAVGLQQQQAQPPPPPPPKQQGTWWDSVAM